MAVYTKLTLQEISRFIKTNYQIGELTSFKEIIDGIDNSNFIINTNQGQFILTIFEKRMENQDLSFFMNLKLHLAKKRICCPKPIANNSNSLISRVKGKSASIVTFLKGTALKPDQNGRYDNITEQHCKEVGKNLASLHKAVSDFKGRHENNLGVKSLRILFNKIEDDIEEYQTDLSNEIKGYLKSLEENWRENLSNGVVHADLFPDNVFFDEQDNLSGIIDFYFAANDLFIYDFAVTVNAWCFNGNNKFNQKKFTTLLNSYQAIRTFEKEELNFLNIALTGAALRFLLTRLYDLFHTPKGSLVKVKDPQEYLHKIRFFYHEYGFTV